MDKQKDTKLLAITGIDGSGKTSVVEGFKGYLEEQRITCAVFNNSLLGPNPITQSLAVSRKQIDVTKEYIPEELDIYMQTIQFLAIARTHLPDMEGAVEMVLADRYDICRVVYARLAGGVGGLTAERMLMLASDLRKPNGIIYLDVSLETAIQRVYRRDKIPSWKEKPEVMQQAREVFEQLLQSTPGVTRIDANRDLGQVLEEVIESYRKGILFAQDQNQS